MKRRISEVLNINGPTELVCVRRTTPVAKAVELMNRHSVGAVLLCELGLVAGILTKRDVLTRVLEPGLDLETTLVGEVMTESPFCVALDTTLGSAVRLMRNQDIAHLPVVSRDGPVGVVSMCDAVTAIASDGRFENRELLTFIHGSPLVSAEDSYF